MKFVTAVAQVLTAGVLLALAGAAAAQQAYPNKTVRVIVPYAAGGSGTNILARFVSQRLAESWGQSVIVDNRPGGNTVIASEALAKSPPDGYTLLVAAMDHVIVPQLQSTPYDPIKDFAPVATIAISEFVLAINPSVPANNLQEFIALAKSKPGQLNYASSATGGSAHLAAEFFSMRAGVKMQHVPYKGGAPAITDLIGGQVQALFNTASGVAPHINAGRLRGLAISGDTRLTTMLPQVPSFTEVGMPDFDVKLWYGILAPAGTPRAIINKVSADVARSLTGPDPEIQGKLISQGLQPFISTPEQFAALLKADLAKFGEIIKTANIKIEN